MSTAIHPVGEDNPNALALKKIWPSIRRHGISQVWIFGSRARGDYRQDSDWDLLVDFSSPPQFDNYMALKLELEDYFGARVDLLSRRACQPRFLKAIEPELLHVT